MGLERCAASPRKLAFPKNAKGKKEAARYIQKLKKRSDEDGDEFPNSWYVCRDCGNLHLTRRRKKGKVMA